MAIADSKAEKDRPRGKHGMTLADGTERAAFYPSTEEYERLKEYANLRGVLEGENCPVAKAVRDIVREAVEDRLPSLRQRVHDLTAPRNP